ncbi:MAG: adenylylsulfate reductase, thioredoxin dependent [Chitinophagaceae bacterium]|nr:adenylylsulfate reductase, thioredoxin dependent [Chitinophagaceae bacterium]
MEAPNIHTLTAALESLSTAEALQLLHAAFPGKVTFSSSFSFEDQVITHDIIQSELPINIFTLDTGRLFAETYSVWNSTNTRYNTHIKAYYPNQSELESFVQLNGPNSFYESVENRKNCCHIRKVEPLKRALTGNAVWITGLRAEHSAARHDLKQLEWDEANQIIKYHPLLYWTTDEVREYIEQHNIPYNPLHDRGFVSIGCAPCTRAIRQGEDFRAGRWWWEDNSKKECGLHEKQHS